MVSSSGASGSSSPASDATCGSGLCMPSTAAASTRSRAGAEQPDQRSFTTSRNERGEGSGRSPVPHDCAGNSASSALACSGLPPRAVAQAAGGHRRQRRAELGREVAQLGLGEPGQRDDGARLPVDDPAQALRQPGDRVADADQDEHLVGDQPSQREQQGRQRRPVGPVRVVDDHDDHGLVVAVEQLQQPGADGDRVVERPGRAGHRGRVEPARPRQLFDDPVGQQRLRLVATRPQHRRATGPAGVGEEPLDQRGLAHPGRAFDLHDPRTAGGRVGEGGAQHGQLGRSAYEGCQRRQGRHCPTLPSARTRSSDPTPREGVAPGGSGAAMMARCSSMPTPPLGERVVPVPDDVPAHRGFVDVEDGEAGEVEGAERDRVDDADADARPHQGDHGLGCVDDGARLDDPSVGHELTRHLRRVAARRTSRRPCRRRSTVGPRARRATREHRRGPARRRRAPRPGAARATARARAGPAAAGAGLRGRTASVGPLPSSRRSRSNPARSTSDTRMPGWVFATSARIDGKNAAAMHGVVSTVIGSASIPRSAPTAERAAPTPATTSRACRAKHLARRGEPGGAVGAVDQAYAQVALQGGDVRAHARLGAVDRRGRGREPPAVRDREEGLQPVQLHPEILPGDWRASPR